MDKRIIKTKKALKDALRSLLEEKNFDSVKATEICERALVSRNTFYNYYTDKYALLEDCFRDYEAQFRTNFEKLQEENNPKQEIEQGFLNFIDAFLDTNSLAYGIPILSNFDLMELYYRSVLNILKTYEDKYAHFFNPKYDRKQLNSFMTLGFWGFINGNPALPKDEIRRRTHEIVLDLLRSPVFRVQ